MIISGWYVFLLYIIIDLSLEPETNLPSFKIHKQYTYEVLQTLNYHNNIVWKLIELKNKNLVSCSHDSSIIFYIKDNNEYK